MINSTFDKSKCKGNLLKGYSGCCCDYCWEFKSQKSKWLVHVKDCEVSIVRKTNRHGFASYGWDDANKKILGSWIHKGPPDRDVKNAVIKAAKELANKLNKKEGHAQ